MRSDARYFRSTMAAIALSATLAGCGLFRDEAPPSQPFELGADETACLKGAGALWGRYFEGGAREAEVGAFWECLDRSLDLFVQRTRGARGGEYAPQELKNFLERYFLGGDRIPDGLLAEASELKRALIGGAADRILREEIDVARARLRTVRDASLEALPHLPLTPAAVEGRSEEALAAAVAVIERIGARLGDEIGRHGRDYELARLEALVDELGALWPQAVPESLRGRRPLLRLMKALVVGGDENMLTAADWPALLRTGARAHGLLLRQAHLAARHSEWQRAPGREKWVALALDATALLEESAARRPGQVIRFTELDRVVDLLEKSDLPAGFAPALSGDRVPLKRALRPLVRRILGGSDFGRTGRQAEGLTAPALRRLRESFIRWSDGQAWLERAFAASGGSGGVTASRLLTVPRLPTRGRVGQDQARWMVATLPPLFLRKDREASFDPSASGRRLSYHGLSRLHWQTELSRLMLRGYAEDRKRSESANQLLQPEFHCFTDDIRRLGILFKTIDPTKYEMHDKRFFEANLFLSNSDGDRSLNLAETVEMFAFLLSADAHLDRIEPELVRACKIVGHDGFGKPKFSAPCMRDHYLGAPKRTWLFLPALSDHYEASTDLGRTELSRYVESLARGNLSERAFDAGELQSAVMVAQYVESLFRRFDLNRSGRLETREARAAFPLFRGVIKDALAVMVKDPEMLAMLSSPESLESLFMYLLEHGRTPDASSAQGKFNFWLWMRQYPDWKVEQSDRTRVLKLFGVISGTGGQPIPKSRWKYSRCWDGE